jgi:hypothetical protein
MQVHRIEGTSIASVREHPGVQRILLSFMLKMLLISFK